MQFFKSAWFKCVTVLLIISVVAGGLLAVLNDLLWVSPDERTTRALNKLYEVSLTQDRYYATVDIDNTGDNDVIKTAIPCEKDGKVLGEIEKIFFVDKENEQDTDFDMLFKAKGNEGFNGGTVTTWVKVEFRNGNKEIVKVVIDSNEKQTFIGKLTDVFTNGFMGEIKNLFSTKAEEGYTANVVAGATKSSSATCNSVNCVLIYLGEN